MIGWVFGAQEIEIFEEGAKELLCGEQFFEKLSERGGMEEMVLKAHKEIAKYYFKQEF